MKKHHLISCITISIILFGCASESMKQSAKQLLPNPSTRTSVLKQDENKQATNQIDPPNSQVMIVSASRPVAFDFSQLMLGSELIIEGQIEHIVETRNLQTNESPVIETDFSVKITKVLKSEPEFQMDSIIVSQRGGTWNGITQVIEDDEPFQIDELVLLFLSKGEIKYGALIPGGRFKISGDGTLESSTKSLDLEIVKHYHGKPKEELETAITNALPDEVDYLATLYPAFLIAEGTITQQGTRLQENEDTQLVYTVYSFHVSRVLYDDLEANQSVSFKPEKYQKSQVKKGDVLTIFEWGGTHRNISQPRVSPKMMPSGSEMLLFLGGFACEERKGLCTQEEQNSGYAMYLAKDPGRFTIEAEKQLKSLESHGWIQRFYDGHDIDKLEKDLIQVKEQWEAKMNAVHTVQDSMSAYPPPPIPTSTR